MQKIKNMCTTLFECVSTPPCGYRKTKDRSCVFMKFDGCVSVCTNPKARLQSVEEVWAKLVAEAYAPGTKAERS